MRRFAWAAGLLAGVLAGAMAATAPTGLGGAMWHHHAGLLAALAAGAAGWRHLTRRRVATLTMAASGAISTVTGFVMLYSKDLPRKDWITWWHSFTSFVLLVAFLAHWLRNHARLSGFARRLAREDLALGSAVAGAWAGVALAAAWTWLTDARSFFTGDTYLLISSWTVLVGVAATYALWLAFRAPALRARLARAPTRNRARSLVDTSLWISMWLATLTGIALLWLGPWLRAGELKYVSKWWHTATSVAFLAVLAVHVGFNARLLAAHARRVDEDLAPVEA